MPRIGKDEKNKGLLATRKWRANLKGQRCPEVDAVDTAIAAAVTVYRYTAEKASSERDVRKTDTLEIMAINYLASMGFSLKMATKRVRRRTRRLDADTLVPLVNAKV